MDLRKRLRVAYDWMRGPASPSESHQSLEDDDKLNESLYSLHKATGGGAPHMQVLFFHGLQFGEYKCAHMGTWKSGDGSCVWPQAWLAERFPDANIYSVSYNAHVTNSSQHGNFHLYNIGENLTYDLMEANIGQESNCPVVLVGHSFGGLVIKQICLHANKTIQTEVKFKNFLANIKGIFYYGTPHHGSRFLEKVAHSLDGPLLQYVTLLSNETEILNFEFDHLCESNKWWIEGLGESLPTKLGRFIGIVVPEPSARNGQHFNIVEEVDHISLCKPMDIKSRSFYSLANFLRKVEDEAKSQEQAGVEEGTNLDNFQHLPKHVANSIDHVVEEIKCILDTTPSLGLTGMGGIGKTTCAKAVFNRLGPQYEYTCFIREVKNIQGGIKSVDQAIITNVYRHGKKFHSAGCDRGLNVLRGKQFLLVLDDAATEEHDLKVLFMLRDDIVDEKSRFIVTSRDGELLKLLDDCYSIPFLGEESSMRLFTSLAFRNQEGCAPSSSFESLVNAVVEKCGGLPLTLEVLGKYLYKQSKQVWEQTVRALDMADNVAGFDEKIWAKLRVSYDGLDEFEKEIFLDAATIFCGMSLRKAKAAWSGTTKTEQMRWQHLVDMSLVTVEYISNKEMWGFSALEENCWCISMHEQLQSLGRKIALNSGETGKPNRISNVGGHAGKAQELFGAGGNCDGNDVQDLVVLKLHNDLFTKEGKLMISSNQLSKMKRLRILILVNVDMEKVDGNERFSPWSTLVCLNWALSRWAEFPLDPALLKQLVVLVLERCTHLQSLPANFGQLSSLRILIISSGNSLESLPDSFGHLSSLEELELNLCYRLETLPEPFGKLLNLKYLTIKLCTSFLTFPESFGELLRLELLNVHDCQNLKSLPDGLGKLAGLKQLSISHCDNIRQLPGSLGNLSGLKQLSISTCANIRKLPDSVGNLSGLKQLSISNCANIRKLPNSVGDLSGLKQLSISTCVNIRKLPDTISRLVGLECLELQKTCLESISDSIQSFPFLTTFQIGWIYTPVFPVLPRQLMDAITPKDYNRCVGWTFDVVDGKFSLIEDRFCSEADNVSHLLLGHAMMMEMVQLGQHLRAGFFTDFVANLEFLSEWGRDFYLQERGILRRLNGDLAGALADLTMALDENFQRGEDDYDLRKHRGHVRFLMGDSEGALIDGKRAEEIMPKEVCDPQYAFQILDDGSKKLKFLAGESVEYLGFKLR